ncbi:MAG: zinc ribbon domain-containing protein [Clostridiales bacterium]|nr:zinc ribbon domain-containing protein [Clostridiales bacterium]
MAFFNKIGEFAKSVGDKTGGMIEVTKLKGKIKDENDAILDLEQKIGALLWTRYYEGERFEDDINELLGQIKEGFDRIAGYQEEIEAINKADRTQASSLICTNCGSANEPDTRFCSSCGTKLTEPTPAAQAEKICSSCGVSNAADTKFCVECGKNLDSSPEPRICTACGAAVLPDTKFCGSCGQKTE